MVSISTAFPYAAGKKRDRCWGGLPIQINPLTRGDKGNRGALNDVRLDYTVARWNAAPSPAAISSGVI